MLHFWHTIDGWGTPEDQGQVLAHVLKNTDRSKHINICELGVYCGRTTAIWNVDLINQNIDYNYLAVDHFQGSAEHKKDRDYFGETMRNLAPIIHKIQIVKNDSISEAQKHPDNYFDLVYIDASHDYLSVLQDIVVWLPKVKNGGFLAGDDYHPGHPGVVKAVDYAFTFETIKKLGNQQWLHHRRS